MSNAALRWAWSVRTQPTCKLVLVCLADHADKAGHCWPSLARLSDRTGLDRSTVARKLGELEELGMIERERSSGGASKSTRYVLQLSHSATVEQSQPATVAHGNSCTVRHQQSQPATPTVAQCDTNPKEPSITLKSTRRKKTALPIDFAISDRVRRWAGEKGFSHLDEHLEAFRLKAASKGYTYADWDAALMTAIRDDWAGLNSKAPARRMLS